MSGKIALARRSWSKLDGRPGKTILNQLFVRHDPIISLRQYSLDALQQEGSGEDHSLAEVRARSSAPRDVVTRDSLRSHTRSVFRCTDTFSRQLRELCSQEVAAGAPRLRSGSRPMRAQIVCIRGIIEQLRLRGIVNSIAHNDCAFTSFICIAQPRAAYCLNDHHPKYRANIGANRRKTRSAEDIFPILAK